MNRTALFTGTFDPPSLGHLDIVERSQSVCDKLYLAVGYNKLKPAGVFSLEERLKLLKTATAHLPYVEVCSFSGLAIDFAKEIKADFLLRGLRAFSDFEYEFRMALANRKMSGIETIFLMTASKYAHVSSSLIREIGPYGRGLEEFVPESICKDVYARLILK